MKRQIMLDAQLLVLLVVGATNPQLIDRHRRTRSDYTRSDFHLLLEILGHSPRFIFCPHVAAEASNLIGQHREPDRSALMIVLKAVLNNCRELGIDCRTAMDAPEFVTLGLTDAAQLASSTHDTVLLTDDEPLFIAASTRGAAVVYFAVERLMRDRERG